MLTFTLKVIEIRKETEDTITLCFKQPALRKVAYQPGQYISLIFRINGRRYVRPYSFSSAPGVDPYLEVTIKRIPGGIVSNHIHDKVTEGDIIEVIEPKGDFVFDKNTVQPNQHIMLWGAGSGITPLISIIKYILRHNTGNKVTLAYGNRNFENAIFLEKLNQLAGAYPDAFKVWHFHTRAVIDETSTYLIQGRIDVDKAVQLLQDAGPAGQTMHYLCGPPGLKASVKAALLQTGVPMQQVHTEDFEVVKNPEDFKDIVTQTVTISLNNAQHEVEVIKGKSILEAGLDALIELPYSCQTGSCSLCKARLTQGSIKTVGIEQLPADVGNGDYLLCCAYPLGSDVAVEI